MSQKRILVVDDDRLNAALMREICDNAGYATIEVHDGESALELVRREAPDLILLDIMMGKVDGFQVCESIRKNPSTAHVPIILVTAIDDLNAKIRGMEAGADDYITKPFRMFDLLTRIRNVLESRKADQVDNTHASLDLGQVGDFRQLRVDLDYEVKRSKRYTRPLTCAMLVLDGYDALFREERSAEAVQLLGQWLPLLHANLREVDRIYRIDDDVFIVIMPETDANSAEVPIARIQKAMTDTIPQPVGVALGLNKNLVSYPGSDISSAQDILKLVTGVMARN
ncbi:MAG: response regulator [Deltaproteobacteria bacterium]|nr:response regulator [Deltaproteobacteria bacterium]